MVSKILLSTGIRTNYVAESLFDGSHSIGSRLLGPVAPPMSTGAEVAFVEVARIMDDYGMMWTLRSPRNSLAIVGQLALLAFSSESVRLAWGG